MSTPIAWPEAQRICDIPEVRELIDAFAGDSHEENMLAMVSAIMGHAVAQGRAEGLEEERAIPEEVKKALDRMCKPLHDSVLSGATAAADAYCMEVIRNYIMSTVSPTSSEAGKDDARDAARWRAMRATTTALRNSDGERLECTPEELDAAADMYIAQQADSIDAALCQPSTGADLAALLKECRDCIDSLPGYPKGADLCDRIDAALGQPAEEGDKA